MKLDTLNISKEEQKVFIDDIYSANQEFIDPPLDENSILRKIQYKTELNNFWSKIKSEFSTISLDHPDLKNLFLGAFQGEFSNLANQMFEIIEFCKTSNYDSYISSIFNSLSKHPQYCEIEKYFHTHDHIADSLLRFCNKECREQGRSSKQVQIVELRSLYKKDVCAVWKGQVSSFLPYRRFHLPYQDDITSLEKKMDLFNSLGCSFLAEEMKSNLEEYKTSNFKFYYGFNKLKLSLAAIIAAKLNGFSCYPNSINHSSDFFEGLFDDEILEYEPRYYTHLEISKFKLDCNEKMMEVIDYLDNFPSISGQCLFDHYRVLVPGIKDKKIKDEELINRGFIVPVLFGERDGNCFFISYWL